MTNPTKAWGVTLSFAPPGPIHSGILLAPDATSATALSMHLLMMQQPTTEPLMAVVCQEIPAETLRNLLRAVEGKLPAGGNAEIVSLATHRREDDAGYVMGHNDVMRRGVDYGEEFGPPWPAA